VFLIHVFELGLGMEMEMQVLGVIFVYLACCLFILPGHSAVCDQDIAVIQAGTWCHRTRAPGTAVHSSRIPASEIVS